MHDNIDFKVHALDDNGITTANSGEALNKDVVCDEKKKACMYRQCHECLENEIVTQNYDTNKELTFPDWKAKTVTYVNDGKKNKNNYLKRTCHETGI